MMKPTLHDIAKRTGLSVATVSRALHRADSPNVSLQTRERVRSVAEELGYRPNLLSRSLVTGRTHTVSYWTFDAFAPYYAAVAREICRQAAQRGYFVHIHNTFDPARGLEEEVTAEATAAPGLALSFDGVIACDVAYPGNRYAEQLHQLQVPLVGIGFSHPTDCDYVNIDLRHGATLAMDHLLGLGCRRIAHMAHADALERRDARAQVFEQRMRQVGLEPLWIPVADHRRDYARQAIADYVRRHGAANLPEAVFCVNDEVAVGCYRGLADVGVEVPRDVLLVGCDGMVDSEYQRCPITTVAAPVERMCELAWDLLEGRLQQPDRPLQQLMLQPRLITRESTLGMEAAIPPE